MTRSIDLITFDADQTLTDFRTTLAVALDKTVAFLNPHLDKPITSTELQERRETVSRRPENAQCKMLELRHISFRELLGAHPDADALADEALTIFRDIRFNHGALMPGAMELLTQLHGQTRLGWITNANSKPLHFGFEQFFDIVLLAEEVSHSKPAPEIFNLALNAAGTRAENWIHVGDHPETDVLGAQGAGGIGIYLENPDHPLGNVVPDHHIASLAELPALLSHYELRPPK